MQSTVFFDDTIDQELNARSQPLDEVFAEITKLAEVDETTDFGDWAEA